MFLLNRVRRNICSSYQCGRREPHPGHLEVQRPTDRKSTRLNSSHLGISYAVFCLLAPTEIYTLSLHDALPILIGLGGISVPPTSAGGVNPIRGTWKSRDR